MSLDQSMTEEENNNIFSDAKNPAWDADRKTITLELKLIGSSVYIPFTASPDDVEEHGRNIFLLAASGEFGEVAGE